MTEKVQQKGNKQGIVRSISMKDWGRSFTLEGVKNKGKDQWFTVSNKNIKSGDVEGFSKGDAVQFEFNYVRDDKGEAVFVNKLQNMAQREPLDDDMPDFLQDVPSPDAPPDDLQEPVEYTLPEDKSPHAWPDHEIQTSRRLAVMKATEFCIANNLNQVDILAFAEDLEKFILRGK